MKTATLLLGFLAALPLAALGQDEIRVIVGFNGRPDRATFERHGGSTALEGSGFVAGNISSRQLASLRRDARVAYVEPDFIATVSGEVPWGVGRVKAPVPGNTGIDLVSGLGVRVAILDTGINGAVLHPDLPAEVGGANYTGSPAPDVVGHGTHVAGTVAALSNGFGVVGVASGAGLLDVKVLDDTGSGYYSWIASGINWAADPFNNCKVINMSLGGSSGSTGLQTAVSNAAKTLTICAAAGNAGTTRAQYPAYYSGCIAVVAVDGADKRASFSSYGSWTDLSAPGVGILSTTGYDPEVPTSGYATWNGTSMATPHVAGAAALVWASSYGSSASSVRSRLVGKRDADIVGPVGSKRYVPGILNCASALQ